MIRLEHVSKTYQRPEGPVRALDDVSLEIAAGRFVALVGPSGCGKSTLLSLVGGLATPTAGHIWVGDTEVSALDPAGRAAFRAREVGFVFQLFHLLPYLSVLDNVLLGAAESLPEARERAETLLRRFGLAERLRHLPGELSAGERQRTALARALLPGPKLLLADEPTGNLDPASGAAVLERIGEFHAAGGTVLLVTHDASAASRAEEVVELRAGRISRAMTPSA